MYINMCSTQSQLFPWEEFQAQDNMGFSFRPASRNNQLLV